MDHGDHPVNVESDAEKENQPQNELPNGAQEDRSNGAPSNEDSNRGAGDDAKPGPREPDRMRCRSFEPGYMIDGLSCAGSVTKRCRDPLRDITEIIRNVRAR